MLSAPNAVRDDALRRIEERGELDIVPALIWYLRLGYDTKNILQTLKFLTGADPDSS